MTVSKKANTTKNTMITMTFGVSLILIGIIFAYLGIGEQTFAGFPNLGIWIIFVGLVSMAITTIKRILRKDQIIDERMEHIGYKASRITTLVLIFALFAVIIVDGLIELTFRYYLFASFLTCLYVFTNLRAYKLIERNS